MVSSLHSSMNTPATTASVLYAHIAARRLFLAFEHAANEWGDIIFVEYLLLAMAARDEEGSLPLSGYRILELQSESVKPHVSRLVSEGYLEWCRSPRDRRAFAVRTTKKGDDLVALIDNALFATLCDQLETLDEPSVREVMDGFTHLFAASTSQDGWLPLNVPIPFLLWTLRRQEQLNYAAHDMGLVVSEACVLVWLALGRGEAAAVDVADALGVRVNALLAALVRLKREGAIVVVEGEGATPTVSLSSNGIAVCQRLAEDVNTRFNRTRYSLSPADAQRFRGLERTVVEGFGDLIT